VTRTDRGFWLVFAWLVSLAFFGFVACGSDDAAPSTAEKVGVEWFSATDPQTGHEFRCVWREKRPGQRSSVAGLWCYQTN